MNNYREDFENYYREKHSIPETITSTEEKIKFLLNVNKDLNMLVYKFMDTIVENKHKIKELKKLI